MTLAAYEEVVDAEIVPDEITQQEARELTDRIRVVDSELWRMVAEAYTRGAHRALGYASWDAYCNAEFGSNRISIPREERAETVQSLRANGLSLRAIHSATGADVKTIRKDLAGSGVGISHTSTLGQDGKTYTRPEPTVSERDWPEVPEPEPQHDSMTVALINDLRGPWRRGIKATAKKMTQKERQILIDAIETTLTELKEI